MKNEIKDKLFEEGLKKFKHRVNYKVNESPRYRSLVGNNEQFDEIPALTTEAGEQEDAPIPGGGMPPPEPGGDQPMGMGEPPAGGGGAPGALPEPPPAGGAGAPPPADPMGAPPVDGGGQIIGGPQASDEPLGMAGSMGNPGQQVDDIQNDIIKHNIAAMKSIDDQLKTLNAITDALNKKSDVLSAAVEEVREPTNSEKLMNKKNVSYPYYFNLNDFWNGNWFSENRKAEHEKGVRELPDGTFIADFDDLPQKSKQDVQGSFNEF